MTIEALSKWHDRDINCKVSDFPAIKWFFPKNYIYYHIKKAKVDDADRLADELRDEQELALEFEKDCKLLESQVKEMEQRLDEAKANGFRNHNKFARVNQSTTFANVSMGTVY